MLRLFTALLFASTVALADEPPKKPAEPAKASPTATVTLRTITVKDGAAVTTAHEPVNEIRQVPVTKKVNGQDVTTVETVMVRTMVVKQTVTKLKDLKATGTDGKAIPPDALEKAYKDGGVLVVHVGKLEDSFRKLFKDGTAFIEETPPAPPMPVAPPK